MDINKSQKRRREKAAEDLYVLLLLLFSGKITDFENEYREVVLKYTVDDEYISEYIPFITQEIEKTTKKTGNTSDDRALAIALNEANTVLGYEEYRTALVRGYKKKTWLTMLDTRVRDTHRPLEDKTIPIDDFFTVGESKMLFPRDTVNGSLKETSGCRCALKYS